MFRRLLVVLLLAVSLHAQEHRSITIPFHSIEGMILLDIKVNGRAVVMLLDTGANVTLFRKADAYE